MKNGIEVVALYKASNMGGMEITQAYLKNAEGEIRLTKEQWDEIKTTMAGKRQSGYSEEFDGYTPKTAAFWN